MSSTIFELTERYRALYDAASDPDMELNADAWFDTMEGINEELKDKLDGTTKVVHQMVSDVNGMKAEEERIATRRKAVENNIKRLKQAMQMCMEATGQAKIKTNLFTFGIQNNPASVVLDEQNIENIPMQYLKYKDPEIDKQKIAEDLKNGIDLNGLAHLEVSKSLRIR